MYQKMLITIVWLLLMLLLFPAVSEAQTPVPSVGAETIRQMIERGDPVTLNNTKITGVLALTGEISAPITITNSILDGEFSAVGVKFKKAVTFRNTTFEGRVNSFLRATFQDAAVFDGAIFVNPVDFNNGVFEDRASFRNTTFQQTANFTNTEYHKLVIFHSTIFSGFTDFGGAHFCTVINSTGGKDCWLTPTVNSAGDTITPPTVNVDFGQAVFNSDVSFTDAAFLNGTKSSHTRITFAGAQFAGKTNFESARFYDVTFSGAKFKETSFRLCQFDTVSFRRSVLTTIDFNEVTVSSMLDLTGTNYTNLKTVDFDFSKLPYAQLGDDSQTQLVDARDYLLRLEDNFRAQNLLMLSQTAYYERRQVERKLEAAQLTPQADLLRWLQDRFEFNVGDYVRLDIPLRNSLLLVLGGAVVYGLLSLFGLVEIVPVSDAPQAVSSSSVLIRLLTLKVPVTRHSTSPSDQQSAAPQNQEPPEDKKQARDHPTKTVRELGVGLTKAFQISLRMFNDSLGGNLELKCRNGFLFLIVLFLAYVQRILGLVLVAGLSITLSNVVPAVKTLFG